MTKKITKKVREEATLIADIWASTPEGWFFSEWSAEAIDLYKKAFEVTFHALYNKSIGSYEGTWDEESHECAAEVAARLRDGWTP